MSSTTNNVGCYLPPRPPSPLPRNSWASKSLNDVGKSLLNSISGNLTKLGLIGLERRFSLHMPLPSSRDVGKLWNETDRMWVVVENKGSLTRCVTEQVGIYTLTHFCLEQATTSSTAHGPARSRFKHQHHVDTPNTNTTATPSPANDANTMSTRVACASILAI